MTEARGTRTSSAPTADDAGYADFFAATWPRLYRTALGVAGDHAAAEDALQAAFAKAYASWRRVCEADHPEAYVRRMVLNEIIGTRRRGFGRRERPSADLGAEPQGRVRESVAPVDADVVSRDAVWRAVLALPVRQRAVVVLRYYEDLSEAQIAAALGCSRGTVKSQASAALAALRRTTGLALDARDDSQEDA